MAELNRRTSEALQRHPDIPKEILERMTTARSGGEAKHILKAWLETQPRKPKVKVRKALRPAPAVGLSVA